MPICKERHMLMVVNSHSDSLSVLHSHTAQENSYWVSCVANGSIRHIWFSDDNTYVSAAFSHYNITQQQRKNHQTNLTRHTCSRYETMEWKCQLSINMTFN